MQPNLITFTYRITGLHYIYDCPTLSVACLCKIYLESYWVRLHLWVSNLVNSQRSLGLPTKSLRYTSLMGEPTKLQPMLVTSSYQFIRSNCTYECPTLSAPHVGWHNLQNQWVTLHLWAHHIKWSLTWLPPSIESLDYTTYMGVKL